jgi:hypothetical protein
VGCSRENVMVVLFIMIHTSVYFVISEMTDVFGIRWTR